MRNLLEWLVLPGLVAIAIVWVGASLDAWVAVKTLEHRFFGLAPRVAFALNDLLIWVPLGVIAGLLISKTVTSRRIQKTLLAAALCPVVFLASGLLDEAADPVLLLPALMIFAMPLLLIFTGMLGGYWLARGKGRLTTRWSGP